MRYLLSILVLGIQSLYVSGQEDCVPTLDGAVLSQRLANYVMDVALDHDHTLTGTEEITWINPSPEEVSEVRLYMYLNAFGSRKSSYLRDAGWSDDLREETPSHMGYVRITAGSLTHGDSSLTFRYIQPDDYNPDDQTVLQVDLAKSVGPGDTLVLSFSFVAKLPRLLVRSGYAEHDFHHFVHWYPKLGVYELGEDGDWRWNCHQFLPRMEFYGDHGNYDVTIRADKEYTIGGSGCRINYKEPIPDSDLVLTRFIAQDVIDFGWVASPDLVEYTDKWRHVDIRLLSPKTHERLVPRLLKAAKVSLAYMDEHVGVYPYHTLNILDPPLYALRSGFMEYPTYITGGSYFAFPKGVRSVESLIVHEFCHQYFMQMVANNEKEDPWLDEGFVTFYEDKVMEAAYGEASLVNFCGYEVNNSAFTRNEYASLSNLASSHITNNSWKVKGDYKGIIYAKTATVLQTISRYLGEENFDTMMRSYFEKMKFAHPRRQDFIIEVKKAFAKHPNLLSPVIDNFLSQALDGTTVCDYAVQSVSKYAFTVERKGRFIAPVEIEVRYMDGTSGMYQWDGVEVYHSIVPAEKKTILSVNIDPQRKLFLDIDFNNNSYTKKPRTSGMYKYALRSIYWVQNALQASSFLM